jgi:hypothetical protein
MDDGGWIPDRNRIFLFLTAFRPALGPTQWVPGAPSMGVKLLEREAIHFIKY